MSGRDLLKGKGNIPSAKVEFFVGNTAQVILKNKWKPLWYFHLKAPNGKIILQSEGYTSLHMATKGWDAIVNYAGVAKVVVKGAKAK